MELLRLKLIHWRKQVRRMSGYKYDKASFTQRTWREFEERNEKNKNQRLKSLLQRFIEKILLYSDATLSITLHQ